MWETNGHTCSGREHGKGVPIESVAVGVESTAAKNSNRLKNLLTQPGKTLLAVSWVFSEKGLGGGLCEI